jgi:hypothetical protein
MVSAEYQDPDIFQIWPLMPSANGRWKCPLDRAFEHRS